MAEPKSTIMCSACARLECRHDYPRGIPPYCLATKYRDVIEKEKTEYSNADVSDLYLAAGRVVAKGYGEWPRIQEAIELAKELKLSKIGFASCVALLRELRAITELFIGAGFDIASVACQVGRVSPEDRGITLDSKDYRGLYCNPIAQAEILNSEGAQLNFILGLCLGHDITFTRYSKAPVSTLIVKDRVTGNNPAAVLYSFHHRRRLWKLYCGKDIVD